MDEARRPKKVRWLNATVVGIGLASLFSDLSHEMATAALPLLFAGLGGASASLGLIEGVADGLASFAKLLSGHYSDRLARRKPLAVVGYAVTAAGMVSFAWATQVWHVLLGRVGGWIGRGARSPVRKVLLAEATTPESYGRAFGLDRTMDSAGAVVGPLVATLALATLGVRGVFLLTLLPGLLAVACIAFLVRERPHTPRPEGSFFGNVRALPATFRRFLLGVGLAGLGDYSNTLLILWATQAWTPRLGAKTAATWAMLAYVGYNVVYTATCALAGWLSDRLPKHRVLAFGYVLGVVPAVALILDRHGFVGFGAAFAFSGLYMGFYETVESVSAATLVPKDLKGTGFGVLDTVNGVGDFVSSALVGLLWALHPAAAMGFVIAVSLAGAWVIVRLPTLVAAD